MSGIIWIIIVGFVAGIIARLLSPGPNNPSGFILTTVLGIAGAFLATFIGQALPTGAGGDAIRTVEVARTVGYRTAVSSVTVLTTGHCAAAADRPGRCTTSGS